MPSSCCGAWPTWIRRTRRAASRSPTCFASRRRNDDAITEYLLAAKELERQGDPETLGTVYRRILEVEETHVGALAGLAANLASRGKVPEAIPLAERAVQLDDANPDHYEFLADLFEKTQRPADREKTMRGLAEVYRQRG